MRTIVREDRPQHHPEPEGQQQINIKIHDTPLLRALPASVGRFMARLRRNRSAQQDTTGSTFAGRSAIAANQKIPDGERHDHQRRARSCGSLLSLIVIDLKRVAARSSRFPVGTQALGFNRREYSSKALVAKKI